MFKKKYILIFLVMSTFFLPIYFLFLYEKLLESCSIGDSCGYDDLKKRQLVKPEPFSFLKKYPLLQSCTYRYSEWQNDTKMAEYYNYTKPASVKLQSKRLTRGFLVYFPIERFSNFSYELKWLYRSWIEMQKFEPAKWRTDLVVFMDSNHTNFNVTKLFFNGLNCSFSNRRSSKNDPPMCTLIEFKSFFKRNFNFTKFEKFSKTNFYEIFLRSIDIFNKKNNQDELTIFYYFLRKNLKNYAYLDSILMAFEGYQYFKQAGFDFLIRSDMDVFLTPLFANWLPRHCNDFYVGRGEFSTDFNDNRLKRIANNLNLKYAGKRNLGSTWYSTPEQFRLVSYLTLFGMAYLSSEEFSQPEREGKVGTMLWPFWHYGVLLLYGQSLALNHLIALNELNVVKLDELIDFPSANAQSVFRKIHIHVFHGHEMFSKFLFKLGKYDNMSVSNENATLVKYYALKMALEGKRTSEEKLYLQLVDVGKNKN
jgi:hypothetical protein